MATNKKFNVRHGLSAGTGSSFKEIVSDTGLIYDVGTLSTLKTTAKTDTVTAINEIYDSVVSTVSTLETKEPMGVLDRAQSTISFDNATKTFSISLAAGQPEFVVWTAGSRRTYTTTQSVSIGSTPATGLYYIYFNPSGVLSYKTTYFDWPTETPIAYVYWNATTAKAEFVADERHGIVLDWQTHEYLHRTRGAVIANGFSISAYTTTGDGSLDTDAQFDLGDGTFFDEDLEVNITHSTTPSTGTFTQVLTGAAEIPVFYISGSSGAWVRDTATEFACKQSATTLQYNLLSGGTWSTAPATNNRYVISWVVATNDIYAPIIAILGQTEYTDIGSAEAALFGDLTLTNFPIFEFRPLWKVIFRTSTGYTNTPNAHIARVLDLRELSNAGEGGGIVSDHGLLTGLADDDHSQYIHTTLTRTGVTAEFNTTGKITTTNNVGIGTTDPLNKLSVVGTGNATTGWSVGSEDGNTSGGLYDGGSTSNSISLSADPGNVGANSNIAFLVDATERARIDSSGRLLVGTASSRSVGPIARTVQFEGTGSEFALSLTRNSAAADTSGPAILMARSRGSAVGANDAVLNGDALGYLIFAGANGTDLSNYAAWIRCDVDGDPVTAGDTTDLPGRLVFSTTVDGASSPTERLRITSAGNVGIGTTNPASQLHITGQFQSTQANSTTTGGGQIYLNGATGNRIDFNTNGLATPSFTTRSVGTKIVLYPNVAALAVDYAFGVAADTLWSSIPQAISANQHRWYAGTTQLADLKGSGELVIGSTSLTGTSSQRLQVTGGAYISGNVGIGVTNPSLKLEVLGQSNFIGKVSIREGLPLTVSSPTSFSVNSQETVPVDVSFSSNGTTMYVLGDTGNDITYYTLSTPWEISSSTFVSQYSVSSQDSQPVGLYFKPDGTKFYMLGSFSNRVYQYTCSTAWDLSTASYDSVSFLISGQSAFQRGVVFKSDGTKLYIIDTGGTGTIYQYSCPTPWSLTGATYDSVTSTGFGSGLEGVYFNSTGDKMVVLIDGTTEAVDLYALSTAWDLSTKTKLGTIIDLSSTDALCKGIYWKDDGTRVYLAGDFNNSIYQYNLTFDSESLNVIGNQRIYGKTIIGNSINHANIANVLNTSSSVGVTAFRPINLIDTSGVIKIARLDSANGAGLELQQWDSTLTTLSSRSFITAESGNLLVQNITTGGRIRLLINTSTEVASITSTGVGIGTTNPSESLDVVGNIKLTGELRGPASFVIDPAAVGDNTGIVVIKGDLQVDGTTTTINSTTLTIDDKNIVIADGSSTLAGIDTAGIDFGSTAVRLRYNYNAGTNSGLSIEGTSVGVGTTAPVRKLHVISSDPEILLLERDGTGNALIEYKSTSGSMYAGLSASGTGWGVDDDNNLSTSPMFFVNRTTGNVGIGVTEPVTPFHVSDGTSGAISTALYTSDYVTISAQGTAPGFNIISANNTSASGRGVFKATRARGTLASPLVPVANDDVFSLLGVVYDSSTAALATAAININVDGAVSAGVAPQRISFWTGTTNARLERMTIKSSGNVGIGTTNPGSLLDLKTATGTDPTTPTTLRISTSTVSTTGWSTTNPWGVIDFYSDNFASGFPNSGPKVHARIATVANSSNGGASNLNFELVDGSTSSTRSTILALSTGSVRANKMVTFADGGIAASYLDSLGNECLYVRTSSTAVTWESRNSRNFIWSQGFTTSMILNSSGNVGIGTTNPGFKLEVSGSFAATTKSFLIDHPTKEGHKLRYGSLEGPENGVYVRGRSTDSVIELPEYWTKLVDQESITVNLTPIGLSGAPRVERIEGNKVYVFTRDSEPLEYFYTVFAERIDVDKLEVETIAN